MQPGLIVRGFVAGPSDVSAERDEVSKVINSWNAVNSRDREAIIEAVKMETHALLEQGAHPQEIINRQLLSRCDFMVAIFWSKLGTPTNKERSGTIHEITEFIERAAQEGHIQRLRLSDAAHVANMEKIAGRRLL